MSTAYQVPWLDQCPLYIQPMSWELISTALEVTPDPAADDFRFSWDETDELPTPKKTARTRSICCHPGCSTRSQSRNLCTVHGGGTRCLFPLCERSTQYRGLCKTHGGSKPCAHENCPLKAHSRGLCHKHLEGPRSDAERPIRGGTRKISKLTKKIDSYRSGEIRWDHAPRSGYSPFK
jgi:hypothetical protein